jgi:hypothetical protein
VLGTGKRAFRNEWRVNQLLVRRPPPVPAPRLLAADRQQRALVFEAVDRDPLGPKFPPPSPRATSSPDSTWYGRWGRTGQSTSTPPA